MNSEYGQSYSADTVSVLITAPLSHASCFGPLFQKGFRFPCLVGTSIEELLLQQLGLGEDTVERKISTIFLDGRCVDHIDTAIIENGSVLALSAALPGLAGATLRRGGYYASLRDPITRREEISRFPPYEGIITVKLFNLLIRDLGAIFLTKGIIVHSPDIFAFFRERSDEFWREIDAAYLDDKAIPPRALARGDIYDNAESIRIRIQERGSCD